MTWTRLAGWETEGPKYSRLQQVAVEYLVILAISVPCERLFSNAEQITNEQRNRLNPA